MRGLRYKVLSHTADLRLEVYGKTPEELFENAAEALAGLLRSNVKGQKSIVKESISITSSNINTLLVDFLNDILAKSYINKAVYKVSDVKCRASNVGASVEAKLIGRSVDRFDEDVKAVTHYEADIQQKDGIWQTKLVLDI